MYPGRDKMHKKLIKLLKILYTKIFRNLLTKIVLYGIINIEIKKGGRKTMKIYIPAYFCDEDYSPSWTGNYAYQTVTIRGIFDIKELAINAIQDWCYKDYCEILEQEIEDENAECVSLDYDNACLSVYVDKYGGYNLNEIVNEEYSVVWDEFNSLGVTDY